MDSARVGLRLPAAEVRFRDLYVETQVYADLSRNLPSVIGFYRECIEVMPGSVLLSILHSKEAICFV